MDRTTRITIASGGMTQEVELEAYVAGVVTHELTGPIPAELAKAQAVAARTYARYAMQYPRHGEAAVCDTTHCQRYALAVQECPQVLAAIAETAGEVLLSGGAFANTVYSAYCAGRTRSAQEVWGRDVAYLVPVDCPCREWRGDPQRFGHGVGMCQRGAQKLALDGWNYRDILAHYYVGTMIKGVGMFDLKARTATGSLLSPYWDQRHQGQGDYDLIAHWNPPTVRLLDQSWVNNPAPLTTLATSLPTTLFTLRDVPMSEEYDAVLADPYRTGIQHAQRCLDQFPSVPGLDLGRVAFTGLNEPGMGKWVEEQGGYWALDDEVAVKLVAYEVARLQELGRNGARGIALNPSRGWPPNTGPDTRVDWTPFETLHQELARRDRGHFLGVHEYWWPEPTGFAWGWVADRIGQCPWNDVQIIIGEAGLSTGAPDHRGWRVTVTDDVFMGQLQLYDEMMRRDPRIVSIEVFIYDATHSFDTFDIRGTVANFIADRSAGMRNEPRPADAALIPRYPGNVTNPLPPTGEPIPDPEPADPYTIGTGFREAMAVLGDEPIMSEQWGAPQGGSMMWGRDYLYFWHPDGGVCAVKREY